MDINAGDHLRHTHTGFEGWVIRPQSGGGSFAYYEQPGQMNIPIVTLLSDNGEVRLFHADELVLVM